MYPLGDVNEQFMFYMFDLIPEQGYSLYSDVDKYISNQ